ncbi:unnamed protein product [Effrenium voratum]|uniref:Uncharacterized protein n=1 Tax=Effrenium voratum TaxID=2562239 RepID=A0AA36JF90_9DINO|nr:unnamed protein product [Effrenium voratum]
MMKLSCLWFLALGDTWGPDPADPPDPAMLSALALALPLGAAAAVECLDPRNFGAVPGDPGSSAGPNWERNTQAIQAAIDAAASQPKPRAVCISGGDFVTSDLYLRSDLRFEISAGARLLAGVNVTGKALIHGENVSNLELLGRGEVHGNAEHCWSSYSPIYNRVEPKGARSHLLYLSGAKDVRVSGLTFRNATFWNIHIQNSQDVTLDGVKVIGSQLYPNNDGIEPDSSVRVSILNSYIDVADDGISPISTVEGGELKELVVRNTTIRSKSHAIKFGSTCDADCHSSVFENITIWDSNSGISVQQRGAGKVYNLTWRDIRIETRYQAPRWWGNGEWLSFTTRKRSLEPPQPEGEAGDLRDLWFENIVARSENGGLLSGHGNSKVRNVTFLNVKVNITPGIGNYSQGQGPNCCLRDENATTCHQVCMGSKDYRPSYEEDVGCDSFGNCRARGLAYGLRVENAEYVKVLNMSVSFASPRQPWFGRWCFSKDEISSVGFDGAKCTLDLAGPIVDQFEPDATILS